METQPIVEKLIQLLQSDQQLKKGVETSLQKAQLPKLQTLQQFYDYLNNIVTHIPTEKELMPTVREFYYVLGMSPDDILKKDKAFNEWMNEFVNTRGDFMDSTASAETLDTFINCPDYQINEYMKGPSGWLTYNQFLGRQIKPGKRPIAEKCNNNVIVSPADSTFKGHWPISQNSSLIVKGTEYSITELLKDSAYKNEFKNGIFTHSFLKITNYHRYHTPVGGVVREVKKTPATTWITETKKPDGKIENIDDVGFQFQHTRAHIIIESPTGFVAVIPVGMGHISSTIITVDEGTELAKGDEFGYFAFGGSDIIMLFQPNVKLTAEKDKEYKQGEKIGFVG